MSEAIVQIQKIDKTKSGSFKALINGVWHICNRKITAAPPIGAVEIEVGNWHTDDGKDIPTIERWRLPEPSSAPAVQAMQSAAPPPFSTFIGQGFISNVVGNAIASGAIKEPGQVITWFNAAKAALEGKKPGVPFDDTLPSKEW